MVVFEENAISGWKITEFHKLIVSENGQYLLVAQDNGEGVHDNIITKLKITQSGFDTSFRNKIISELVVFNIVKTKKDCVVNIQKGMYPLSTIWDERANKDRAKRHNFSNFKIDNYVENVERFSSEGKTSSSFFIDTSIKPKPSR